MDKIFKDQICWEIDVFIDDMVEKSPYESQHCEALASVFATLLRHKLRRGYIKAQVLADFITKLTSTGEDKQESNDWTLLVDGTSNQMGSGAEYEALLVGMKLAKELWAKVLIAKSDSQLMIGQMNEEYQAKDP
ncbi:hypothetical protein CR513_53799, partial [Mucuna pruriens]